MFAIYVRCAGRLKCYAEESKPSKIQVRSRECEAHFNAWFTRKNMQGTVIILECCFIKKVLSLYIINVKRAFRKRPQLSLLFTSYIILVHLLINLSAYFWCEVMFSPTFAFSKLRFIKFLRERTGNFRCTSPGFMFFNQKKKKNQRI